jgi:hypothetical protein
MLASRTSITHTLLAGTGDLVGEFHAGIGQDSRSARRQSLGRPATTGGYHRRKIRRTVRVNAHTR